MLHFDPRIDNFTILMALTSKLTHTRHLIQNIILIRRHLLAVGEQKLGRRRRKVLRVVRRTLPKVFACPRCGMVTIRITSHEDEASQDIVYLVACGNSACGLRRELRYPVKRAEVDVYNTFVDDFAKAGV